VKQLADFGADVVKIEPPETVGRGELYVGARDGADMQNLHRNKRSITLDLKSPQARDVLLRLVRTADVVVENFRPEVKERLGFDYDTLRRVNPRLILASISGFGQDGPYRDRPGFDQILQGMCGLMSLTGEPDGRPMRAGASVVDVTAGLYCALGILTALLERETSGCGQWVQVSLLHAGIGLMDYQAALYTADSVVSARVGNDHPTSMPTSTYRTENGWLNVGVGNDAQWRRMCEALGHAELSTSLEYATNGDRLRNRALLNSVLQTIFALGSTEEWIQRLSAVSIPCGPIYTMDQVFADPQVIHSGIAEEVSHPDRGPIRLISQVVKMTRTPARMDRTLEEKGAGTADVLGELGFGPFELEQLRALHVI
jgi:crotonobetainyl-CoA:carnitine CoA-transferase CaiB-like acyl-CoA transferase